MGVQHISVYTFSIDNKALREVSFLMRKLSQNLHRDDGGAP
jgi:undecaprenyl pyrophosphate synthase